MRGVCVCFVLLASCTARNVLVDEGGKTWPPKLRCNELASLENSGVTCCRMVMVSRDNGTAEGGVCRDVDTILEGQDTSIIFPIGEMRVEFGGEFSGECVEGVKDKGVGCGGGSKPVRQGGINEVDKEGVREEGDILVVGVRGGDMVGVARECIRGAEFLSWDVGKRSSDSERSRSQRAWWQLSFWRWQK